MLISEQQLKDAKNAPPFKPPYTRDILDELAQNPQFVRKALQYYLQSKFGMIWPKLIKPVIEPKEIKEPIKISPPVINYTSQLL